MSKTALVILAAAAGIAGTGVIGFLFIRNLLDSIEAGISNMGKAST